MFTRLLALLALAATGAHAGRRVENGTFLDDYVWTKDEHFNYFDTGLRLNGSNENGNVTWEGKLYNLTSQQWQTPEKVSRSVWWHVLLVVEPSNADPADDIGMLWVTGSSNDHDPFADLDGSDEDVVVSSVLAMESGQRVAALYQVPNVHIQFANDPSQANRGENAVMSWGWASYLESGDPSVITMPAMVKSAVAAIDALEEIWGTSNFVVSGASKRGWTTWLTGATDDRVKTMIPVVMDALGMHDYLHRMYRAYDGGYSFALEDFYNDNITQNIDSPNMQGLMDIIDPVNYLDRFTDSNVDIVMCDASGDEFFMEDDATYWWSELDTDSKWSLYVPETDHILVTGLGELLPAIGSVARAARYREEMPTLAWEVDDSTGDITVWPDTDPKPDEVTLWSSRSCGHGPDGLTNRRDFRLSMWDDPCLCGVPVGDLCINAKSWWSPETLEPQDDGSYFAHKDARDDGLWTAFFIEARWYDRAVTPFPRINQTSFAFTSGVSIVPRHEFPAEDCTTPEECRGVLV